MLKLSAPVMPIVDTDTHLSEPPDLWTSRLPSKWSELAPKVVFDERRGEDIWIIGGRRLSGVSGYAMAGWHEYPPKHPPSAEEADPAAFDAKERVKRMDSLRIAAEIPYPNLLAFSMDAFMGYNEPELVLDCIRAYNDFLTDFASVAPERFVCLTTLPFWDLDEAVKELNRCYDNGHRGINFMAKPYKLGLPRLRDDHWAPILKAAEERQLSVKFHVGYQSQTEEDWTRMIKDVQGPADYAQETTMSLMGLCENVSELLLSGVCHKYPGLNFVNVESGFGWIPYLIESADWNWKNSGAAKAHPDRELPSHYFRNQIYTTYWFERETVRYMGAAYADNLMFETDFPHPTSLSPGPASTAMSPREVVDETLNELPMDACRKIFYENAARLYHIDVDACLQD